MVPELGVYATWVLGKIFSGQRGHVIWENKFLREKFVSYVYVYLWCRHYAANLWKDTCHCTDSCGKYSCRPLLGKWDPRQGLVIFCDVLFIEVSGLSMDQDGGWRPRGLGHMEKFKSYHYSNDRRPLQRECRVQAERREPGLDKYSGAGLPGSTSSPMHCTVTLMWTLRL